MTWFKLDDQFHDLPKVLAAGNAPIGLYCRLGCYCADKLTDGFVADAVARNMGTSKELRALLVCPIPDTRPLLTKVDGGYLLRDYLDYNPSREQVLAERAKAKDRMDKIRGRSADVRANNTRTNGRSSHVPVPDPLLSYISDQTDSLITPAESSSEHDRIATLWATELVKTATVKTTAERWITGTAANKLAEQREAIDEVIAAGLDEDTAIKVLCGDITLPKQAAWHADPHCEHCDGTGLARQPDDRFGPCHCRRVDPYLASVHHIHGEPA